MTSRTPSLRVTRLVKRYASLAALDGLTLSLEPGTFVVLLGPNGAGKSTLFQLLTGLFAPDEGEVEVCGDAFRRAPARALRHIGVVFQQMSLDLDLSVRQNLRFHADLQGLPATTAVQRIDEDCQAAGLGRELDRPVRELSGGNRRKVELVRALLHRPAVVLMDEPTVGLDPQSRRDLLAAIVRDVATRGSTVLWATHLVEEAAGADRILVLHKGRLLADGAPAEVTQALGGATLEAGFLRATAPAPVKSKEIA